MMIIKGDTTIALFTRLRSRWLIKTSKRRSAKRDLLKRSLLISALTSPDTFKYLHHHVCAYCAACPFRWPKPRNSRKSHSIATRNSNEKHRCDANISWFNRWKWIGDCTDQSTFHFSIERFAEAPQSNF